MHFNSDFKYDLQVGMVSEKALADIFANKKVEVKSDLKAAETGNIFVEYESRGMPSGIAKSEAEYYCFHISHTFVLIKLEDLKRIARRKIGTVAEIRGGDNNTSKGVLIPIAELFTRFD